MPMSEYVRELRALVGNRTLQFPGVAAIVRREDGRVLFVRDASGRCTLPAGMVEPGEPHALAVVREVYEETGLDVDVLHLVGVFGGPGFHETYPNGHQVDWTAIVFECVVAGGEQRPVDGEIESMVWLDPSEAPPHLRYPDDLLAPGLSGRFVRPSEVVVDAPHAAPDAPPIRVWPGERVRIERVSDAWPALVHVIAETGVGMVPVRNLSGSVGEVTVVIGHDTQQLTTERGQVLRVVRRDDESGWLWCAGPHGGRGWVPLQTLRGGREER